MKYFILIIALCISGLSFAQTIDTTLVNYRGTQLYHIKCDTNSKVLTFLHGGVRNPIFKDSSQNIGLDYLLEGNTYFVSAALRNGFDLLIPLTNDSMNWLKNPNYCHELTASYLNTTKEYTANFISGFSDGGTGSYKIFYTHPDNYDGLIVFNGFPQQGNFHKNVNYDSISDKRIIFSSTFKDKRIDYSFLLTEYDQQKKTNPNTYLYVREGGHTFGAYNNIDFKLFFDIINGNTNCVKTEPIHGFMKEDKLIEFYPFRKKIWKKYLYTYKDVYLKNQEQSKLYLK